MRRLAAHEFERLDAFLLNLEEDDAMMLSTLDGFLSGVVVCPELILPSEWLPAIWGGNGPAFADEREAREILGLIMTRYNEIAHDLGKEGHYTPILETEGDDDSALWEIWAEGFADAMVLRPDSWAVYDEAEDDEVSASFHLLSGLAARSVGYEDSPLDIAELVGREAHEVIPRCLETLNAARMKMQPAAAKPAATSRTGRNDPCPCGSGKKFKKCCLN
jgi:uncharacterized protein